MHRCALLQDSIVVREKEQCVKKELRVRKPRVNEQHFFKSDARKSSLFS
jgi:hypothetical protein